MTIELTHSQKDQAADILNDFIIEDKFEHEHAETLLYDLLKNSDLVEVLLEDCNSMAMKSKQDIRKQIVESLEDFNSDSADDSYSANEALHEIWKDNSESSQY
jgi:ElaB/YqjD/DUF883 family membrane-anchored ribosome-binding protein